MMNLDTFFTLRFKTVLAGLDFIAEVDCANVEDARVQFLNMQSQAQDVELVAALIGVELAKPSGNGCYPLEEESEALLAVVLKELKLGAEHYFNERMGSYDRFNNTVTPADFGIVFPDGSMRIVWEAETASRDFDTSLEIVKGVVELLIEAQELSYFQQTEAELEDNDYESLSNRRIELLFAAGLWPAEDGTFEPAPASMVEELLAKYKDMLVTEPVPA